MFLTSTADGVTTLTLNRPPVNAISEDWVAAFETKLDDLARGPRFTVLHIRSEQKVFCAGADLKEVQERMDAPDGPDRMYAFVAGIQRLYFRIEALPQVTLAEIGGAAMGGGFELALACDLRIAANEAKIGLPEVRLGLIPGAGGTQRLTRLFGPGLASRLILGAEILDGDDNAHCFISRRDDRQPDQVGMVKLTLVRRGQGLALDGKGGAAERLDRFARGDLGEAGDGVGLAGLDRLERQRLTGGVEALVAP